jgi:glucoamylase
VEPRWTSSKKDAVSTAYSASSRVWFTVSHGTLNEIYYPTIDRPQTRDMELLFTDGETFFHEEKRDLTYDFTTSTRTRRRCGWWARSAGALHGDQGVHRDPHHSVVLMNVKITGDESVLERMKCYALLAPHLNGGGAGNSARSVLVAGQAVLLAWKGHVAGDGVQTCGFTRSSCGYVGASDGYQDLMTDMKMTGSLARRWTGTSR